METDWKKKYEEVLNKARELHGTVAAGRDFLAEIFPELRESEDEKIRKALIRGLSEGMSEHNWQGFGGATIDECLAYLEKQRAKERLNRMAPIYNDKESFESALEKAWKYYNESASRTVDSFEDDYIECVFSKGFREGFLYKDKQKEQQKVICDFYNKELSDIVSAELYKYSGSNSIRSPWALDSTGVQYPLYFANLGAKWQKNQKPVKWSEEDEKMLEEIINHIYTTSVQRIPSRPGSDIGKSWIKFLKSLCPHWKPSEGQMKALQHAIDACESEWDYQDDELRSLLNDLKKLI